MMKLERRSGLTPEQFVTEHIVANKPVIITDAMSGWEISTQWTPEYLEQKLGEEYVQIYDNLFDLQDVGSLHDYFAENFGRPADNPSTEYVRWYTKFKDTDFAWADESFSKIRENWSNPYFLASGDFIIPFCAAPDKISAVDERFPYKGLFISGAGARTRLHRDPWMSDAVLCQCYGRKSLTVYPPDQAGYLQNGDEFVDPQDPDLEKFPEFHKATPVYEDVLEPGEALYFAGGWFHDVTSLTDSISVTWNFMHAGRLSAFYEYVKKHPEDKQLEVVRFFLGPRLGDRTDTGAILEFLERQMERTTAFSAGTR